MSLASRIRNCRTVASHSSGTQVGYDDVLDTHLAFMACSSDQESYSRPTAACKPKSNLECAHTTPSFVRWNCLFFQVNVSQRYHCTYLFFYTKGINNFKFYVRLLIKCKMN